MSNDPTTSGWAAPPAAPASWAAGGTGYGVSGPYGGGRRYPLKGLTTALTVLLASAAVIGALGALALFARASAVDDFLAGDGSISALNDADDRVAATLVPWMLVMVAVFVVGIVWQHRHAVNAETLRGKLGLGPGWAIGGWFIPLAWFVLPAMQLAQAAKASDPDVPPGQPRSAGKVPGLVIVWAILFGISGILFATSGGLRPNEEELDVVTRQEVEDVASSDRTLGAAMLVLAGASAARMVMHRQLAARQALALERLDALVPAGSPATGWGAPAPPYSPPPYPAPPPYRPAPAPSPPPPTQAPPPSPDGGFGPPG